MQLEHGDPTWIELTTDDLPAAAEFYRRVFGWSIDRDDTAPTATHVARLHGRPVAGLTSALDNDGFRRFSTSWKVFLRVDDISAATSRAATARGRIMSPPHHFAGYGHHAVLEDPAGAMTILWEPGGFDGFVLGAGHGQPCWFELITTGFDEVRRFYNAVTGWVYHYTLADGTLSTHEPRPGRFRYAINGGRGEATAGIADALDELDEETTSFWSMCLAVDDIDDTCGAVADAGGRVLDGPVESPFGRMASVADPSGATFRIMRSPGG